MLRVALLVLAFTETCNAILPEIVDSGISHILQDNYDQEQTEPDSMFVEVDQLQEDPQPKLEDAFHQKNNDSVNAVLPAHHPSHHNDTASAKVTVSQSVPTSVDQETNITDSAVQYSDLGNNFDHGCITNVDCGKGRYCLYDTNKFRCVPCKAVDVSCALNEQCCGEQLCVWGQCSQNATKGEPGTPCQQESECNADLCCAFHEVLLFPVCTAKPIERERCFGASNHLMDLLSWNVQNDSPRKHCPCVGDLHCQNLGRGSMCLKGEDSSEEDLTDTMYSEIDYII